MSCSVKVTKVKLRTLRVSLILREDKRRGENNHAANKSLDVRAKQRLCYRGVFLPLTCVVAVSPHVISTVRQLPLKPYITIFTTPAI